jgi:branched-subunit amino acid transport protein
VSSMGADLVPLAVLMALVTYPLRAVPMLVPGVHQLPERARLYLRLVAPAVLASLSAISVMVVSQSDGRPTFHIGYEWLAVALCVIVVGLRRSLFLGILLATGLMASLRAVGVAP